MLNGCIALLPNVLPVNTAFESPRLEYDGGIGCGYDIDEAKRLIKRLILEAIYQTEGVFHESALDALVMNLEILFHDQTEKTDGDRTQQRAGWPAGKKKVPKPQSIGDSLRKLAEMRSQRDGNSYAQSANDV